MSMRAALFGDEPIPDETACLAWTVFPKGNLFMQLRDHLGMIYQNHQFLSLFSPTGQPALAPARLALVTIMQFIEGLSDRQAADAVRDRRSWKYALGLPLTDTGFDFSVLSEFRARLIAGNTEELLLTTMLDHLKTAGLIKARGSQRTDSTHVLSAVRSLSRLETVGETLRAMLEQIAAIAPAWLMLHITPDWFDRYSRRIEEYRLPKGTDARRSYAETIGRDGLVLILALAASTTPPEIVALPIVQTFRATWEAQYLMTDTTVKWRTAAELPVAGKRFDSPYDPEAHFGNKRTTTWNGYKVHLTETCDPDALHVITHVATTSAVTADAALPAQFMLSWHVGSCFPIPIWWMQGILMLNY